MRRTMCAAAASILLAGFAFAQAPPSSGVTRVAIGAPEAAPVQAPPAARADEIEYLKAAVLQLQGRLDQLTAPQPPRADTPAPLAPPALIPAPALDGVPSMAPVLPAAPEGATSVPGPARRSIVLEATWDNGLYVRIGKQTVQLHPRAPGHAGGGRRLDQRARVTGGLRFLTTSTAREGVARQVLVGVIRERLCKATNR
jgi:hypothetical protein